MFLLFLEELPKNDRQKLEDLYVKYGKKIYSASFSVLKNQSDAEDAVQNSFLKISKKLRELDGRDEPAIRGYCLTVAANESYDILRRKKEYLSEEEIPDMSDKTDLTVKVAQGAEYEFAVAAMRRMDGRYRAPLYLRYVMGFSLKEVALQLGRNEATVRSQISRGLALLKKELTEAGYES
ncbi:MAG: sigma-70 family RNA polymerase sigma factor [Clostridia bacterium]|nr:sigma-70 family RNA polymerase sigma factor [Clostridia bacterium]